MILEILPQKLTKNEKSKGLQSALIFRLNSQIKNLPRFKTNYLLISLNYVKDGNPKNCITGHDVNATTSNI